jgi:hypothetical protein
MASVLPRSSIEGIFLGTATSGAVASGFLGAIHLIFFVSALLCLAAIFPSVLRGPPPAQPTAPPSEPDEPG